MLPRWIGRYGNRNFLFLYLAMLISLTGSRFLHLAYAAELFSANKDARAASWVFTAEWLTSLAVLVVGVPVSARLTGRRLLCLLDLTTAAITAGFLLCLGTNALPLALVLIAFRAFFGHMTYAARMRSLFELFAPGDRDFFSPLLNSAYYFALGVAGLVATASLALLPFWGVVVLDIMCLLSSAILVLVTRPLPGVAPPPTQAARRLMVGASAIRRNRLLADAVFYIVILASLFQGVYSPMLVAIPQGWFGLGKAGTGYFYVAMSVAFTAGSILYHLVHARGITRRVGERAWTGVWTTLAAGLFLLLALTQDSLPLNLICFTLTLFCFEMAWLHQQTRIVIHASPENIASVSALQNAIGYTAMAVTVMTSGALIQSLGIPVTILIAMVALTVLILVWELSRRIFSRSSRQSNGSLRSGAGATSLSDRNRPQILIHQPSRHEGNSNQENH